MSLEILWIEATFCWDEVWCFALFSHIRSSLSLPLYVSYEVPESNLTTVFQLCVSSPVRLMISPLPCRALTAKSWCQRLEQHVFICLEWILRLRHQSPNPLLSPLALHSSRSRPGCFAQPCPHYIIGLGLRSSHGCHTLEGGFPLVQLLCRNCRVVAGSMTRPWLQRFSGGSITWPLILMLWVLARCFPSWKQFPSNLPWKCGSVESVWMVWCIAAPSGIGICRTKASGKEAVEESNAREARSRSSAGGCGIASPSCSSSEPEAKHTEL